MPAPAGWRHAAQSAAMRHDGACGCSCGPPRRGRKSARTGPNLGLDPSMLPSARYFRAFTLIVGALLLGGAAAEAQSWPSRTITLIVAFPPSTTTDFAARAIAQ